MKKNIIIALLTLTTVCSVFFALYQKTLAEAAMREALKQEAFAKENERSAIEAKKEAEIQKQLADECSRHKN